MATTLGEYPDLLEERLTELPAWPQMSQRERQFNLAYAATGSKSEACRFINRNAEWCHDRRFRTEAFMELVTPGTDGADSLILSIRSRLLAEVTIHAELGALLALDEILRTEPSRRTGVTYATQLRAGSRPVKWCKSASSC